MKHRHTLFVAGTEYHQKELRGLVDKNSLWSMTKKEAVEEYFIDEDEPIYKYEKEVCIFGIQAEPDNPFDPGAIKVFADEVFIGYIPQGHLPELKRLLVPGVDVWIEIYGGDYKYLEYDSGDDWIGTMDLKYYKFVTERDNLKAIIILEWEQ